MLTRTSDMPKVRERQVIVSGLMRLTTVQLAVAGWCLAAVPSMAATTPTSYANQYRSCTGRLASVDVSAEAAATACAGALNPVDLSKCVSRIKGQTTLAADEALSYCGQVRRPIELSNCVVGISRNSERAAARSVLDYCGRSLLPENFAECVVGLNREIDIAPNQALDSCISATDRLPSRDFSPTFVPQNGSPPILPTGTPSVPQGTSVPIDQLTAPSQPLQSQPLSPSTPVPQNQLRQ